MSSDAYRALDFGLGETADMIRKSVAGFAADRIAPRAQDIDRTNEFPRDLWPQMGALGLLGSLPGHEVTYTCVPPGSGHRIGLESAIAWVMACVTRYRLPETTRWAHRLASEKPNRI